MITRPTTLLLGAGASAHLGFPLGFSLRKEILRILRPRNLYEKRETTPESIHAFRVSDEGKRFTDIFSKGQYLSIDELLADHEDFQTIGKQLIAYCLQKCELEDELYDDEKANWYQVLGAALGARNQDDFRNNKLGIVTFNYDRSIDRFLHNLVMHKYKLDSSSAWSLIQETIPIVHLHGLLAPYPEFSYAPGDHWTLAADHIKVVHEMTEGKALPEFQKADQMLEAADSIHIVGFSMGERNIENLPFFRRKRRDSQSGRIHCAIGKICEREYADMRERLRDCEFLDGNNLHRKNSDEFYNTYGFSR